MLRIAAVAIALCLPGLLFAQDKQAQDKKKSAEQVWNDLFAKREGKDHQFNKFLAEGIHRDIDKNNLQGERYGYRNNELPKLFAALRVRYYEDTVAQADWDRSGGKPVPVVRLLAVKEAAARAR